MFVGNSPKKISNFANFKFYLIVAGYKTKSQSKKINFPDWKFSPFFHEKQNILIGLYFKRKLLSIEQNNVLKNIIVCVMYSIAQQ